MTKPRLTRSKGNLQGDSWHSNAELRERVSDDVVSVRGRNNVFNDEFWSEDEFLAMGSRIWEEVKREWDVKPWRRKRTFL